MKTSRSTTTIEIISLLLLTLILGGISKSFTEAGLIVTSGYLMITLWRRNRFCGWLEGRLGSEALLHSDLWTDVIKRIQIERAEAKKNTAKVTRELEDLKIALSSLNVGILLTNEAWILVWWNRIGGDLLSLRDPDDRNSYLFNLLRTPALKNHATQGNLSDALIIENHSEHNTSLELFFCKIPSAGHIILVRDITLIQKLDEMRSDFIANVSHELKTPLTVINGYLETLIDNELVDGVAKKAVHNAANEGSRMSNIIQDLITLSQLETSQVPGTTSLNVAQLLKAVSGQAELLKENLRKTNTTIELNVTESWIIEGNENEIFSLFANLLSNSIRYCPDGATIKLDIETSDGSVALCVRDDGPGISESNISRLTERFYRVDKSHSSLSGGTGLGLAIAKHIMNRHDGTLRITSEVGRGTCVICLFPRAKLVQSPT